MKNKLPISLRYPDLLSEQHDPALLDLVQDLETLYTSHELPARLTRPVELTPHAASVQPAALMPEQPGTLASFPHTRRSRWSRLNALAAVLFTTILIGALVGTFYLMPHAGNTSKVLQKPTVCKASSSRQNIQIHEMHMMTATQGWARGWLMGTETGDLDVLLHTNDSACHWTVISPHTPGSLLMAVYYFSGTSAWIATNNNLSGPSDNTFSLTTDSGSTWATASQSVKDDDLLVHASIESVSFINATTGWLLSMGAIPDQQAYVRALYHTTDGGLTWLLVTSTTTGTPPAPSSLPLSANGLQFLNSSTGWITGADATDDTWFYVTHDGGHTWQKQDLPLPSGVSSFAGGNITHPPQFFSARDGLFTFSFWSPSGICVYITHDGGITWLPTTFLPTNTSSENKILSDRYEPTPVLSFADMQFGWLWEGTFYQSPNTLITTHDGGQHWISFQPILPATYTSIPTDGQADFISSKVGWMILEHIGQVAPQPALFQTLDGGKTWAKINYTVS